MKTPGAGGKAGDGRENAESRSARAERIRLLRERIEDGSYRVPAKRVARKLVEDALRAVRSRGGGE